MYIEIRFITYVGPKKDVFVLSYGNKNEDNDHQQKIKLQAAMQTYSFENAFYNETL